MAFWPAGLQLSPAGSGKEAAGGPSGPVRAVLGNVQKGGDTGDGRMHAMPTVPVSETHADDLMKTWETLGCLVLLRCPPSALGKFVFRTRNVEGATPARTSRR